jgi:putative effector of murein hydrolase LrgA (UPF0299 family)
MTPIIMLLLFVGTAIAIGRWRKFNSIQWIWLITTMMIGLIVIWLALAVFVVGPQMKKSIPNLKENAEQR